MSGKLVHRNFKFLLLVTATCFLQACSSFTGSNGRTYSPKKATSRPYVIKGVRYEPQQHYEYDEVGIASHYGDGDNFHGKKTATGEVFDTNALTGAHKTLPLPSVVQVTNLETGRSIKLKLNDRGPFPKGRIIDVSRKAAQLLGFYKQGTVRVRVQSLVAESKRMAEGKRGAMIGGHPVLETQKPIPQLYRAIEPQSPRSLPVMRQVKYNGPVPQAKPGWLAFRELVTPPPHTYSTPVGQMVEAKGMPVPGYKPAGLPKAVITGLGVVVNAGKFRDYSQAVNMRDKVAKWVREAPVAIQSVTDDAKPLYIVSAGPFNSSERAEGLVYLLEQSGQTQTQIIYR
jgi:rare lipoprotein A